MNLSEYQKAARETAIYLDIDDSKILYPALGIINECGEMIGKIKKIIRDDNISNWDLTEDRKYVIAKELGDCCWYLANICCDINLDLSMIYDMRGASIIQQVRQLILPRLALHMNRHANAVSESLEQWYYDYNAHICENTRFTNIPNNLSHIIACIEEIGNRCGFTLEEIYSKNIDKLSGRKERGTLKGDGDNR